MHQSQTSPSVCVVFILLLFFPLGGGPIGAPPMTLGAPCPLSKATCWCNILFKLKTLKGVTVAGRLTAAVCVPKASLPPSPRSSKGARWT